MISVKPPKIFKHWGCSKLLGVTEPIIYFVRFYSCIRHFWGWKLFLIDFTEQQNSDAVFCKQPKIYKIMYINHLQRSAAFHVGAFEGKSFRYRFIIVFVSVCTFANGVPPKATQHLTIGDKSRPKLRRKFIHCKCCLKHNQHAVMHRWNFIRDSSLLNITSITAVLYHTCITTSHNTLPIFLL